MIGIELVDSGYRPDYDSGPYISLIVAAIQLARLDLSDPRYSESAKGFLVGDLVQSFSEVIGFGGSFLDGTD